MRFFINGKHFFTCFLLLSLTGAVPLAVAQKSSVELARQLASQGKTAQAKAMFSDLLSERPGNSLVAWELGNLHRAELKEIFLYNKLDWDKKFGTVLNLYTLASTTVNRKELRKNRDSYQRLFGSKKVSAEAVRLFYRQELAEAKGYGGQVELLREITASAWKHYQQSEEAFFMLATQYQQLPALQMQADGYALGLLNQVASNYDSMRSLIVYRQQVLQQFRLEEQKQQFIYNQVNGFEAEKVSQKAFEEKRVILYNYGPWAQRLSSEIQQVIIPLKQKLLTTDALLNVRINNYLSGQAAPLPDNEPQLNQLIYHLFRFDPNSIAAKLVMYKKSKVAYLQYLSSAANAAGKSKEKDSRGLKIKELYDILQNIVVDNEDLKRYNEYILKVYGGRDGLQQFLIAEQHYISRQMSQMYNLNPEEDWLLVQEGNEGESNGEEVYKGTSANTDSLLAFGKQVILKQLKLPGGKGAISAGYIPSENRKQSHVYLALQNSSSAKAWQRKFMYQSATENLDNRLQHIVTTENGDVFMSLRSGFGNFARNRLAGVDASGEILFDHPPENNLVARSLAGNDKRNFIAVLKGTAEKDNFNNFETCRVLCLNRFGSVLQSSDLLMKGLFTDLVPWKDGYLLVVNFLVFTSPEGENIYSQAKDGGFNVLLAFLNEKGEIYSALPVFSKEPVYATAAEPAGDKKIKIRGISGNYRFSSEMEISGGQPWEYVLD